MSLVTSRGHTLDTPRTRRLRSARAETRLADAEMSLSLGSRLALIVCRAIGERWRLGSFALPSSRFAIVIGALWG